MKNSELNKYILHYLEYDKTHSAIMLTAPWGTGKSYYIQNELIPYLQDEKNGQYKCIVISLYGLKDLYEVSKALYLEIRMKFLNGSSEKAVTGKFAAKTVLKGITSFFGIDLSKTEEEMQDLYNSVDLSGKLIIFEDLERSGISITEILGYVNSLVEQDGVKVLLVANEKEIIKKEKKKTEDGKETDIWVNTDETELYLRTKEKTVSDTIHFAGDRESALESILRSFEDPTINCLLEQKDGKVKTIISEIEKVIDEVKDNNLRSIIFGCQKTINLYQIISKLEDKFDDEFLSYLLCSNIAFSLRLKKDNSIRWNDEDVFDSQKLGTYTFPLLRTAYNYILLQSVSKKELVRANTLYCEQREFEKSKAEINEHLNIIYCYFDYYEKDVADALSHVAENLEKAADIPTSAFGKLANHLVAVHAAIGHDEKIQRCRSAMVERLKLSHDKQTEMHISMHNGLELRDQKSIQELDEWKKEMLDALKSTRDKDLAFDYQPESIAKFYKAVGDHHDDIVNSRHFASQFDVDKTVEFLKKASPEQIGDLRRSFLSVYDFFNISDFFSGDKETLIEMKNAVDKLIERGEIGDRIILLQLNYFSGNLQSFIEKL